jgi:hypothetical protein
MGGKNKTPIWSYNQMGEYLESNSLLWTHDVKKKKSQKKSQKNNNNNSNNNNNNNNNR